MNDLDDEELNEIERRFARVRDLVGLPWHAWLEGRDGTGGASFIAVDKPDGQDDIYVEIHSDEKIVSPSARLDAFLDFVAHASEDVPKLLAEVRRRRGH
jgi:hypothetical protein